MKEKKPKVLAINLPQFHPFKENDEWWGKGFTEWTNVTKAKPLFNGHYQPQLPTETGFYDLRVPEARKQQADLAKEHGINGFAYYHYWFHGKRLMNEPIDQILESKEPDFPFCFFWANETWSRRWTGEESEVLISQDYSWEDDRAHAEFLIPFFQDSRYIKINNRPLFVVYKPFDLPNSKKTIEIFEEVCKENGLEKPYFIASNSHNFEKNPYDMGFDNVLNFQARQQLLSEFMIEGPTLKKLIRNVAKGVFSSKLRVYTFEKYLKRAKKFLPNYKALPCVLVGFDNTARRGEKAIILKGQSPKLFKETLIWAKEKVQEFPEEEQIVFINAWNEWAEGNQLEPSDKFGRKFLEVVKEVFT